MADFGLISPIADYLITGGFKAVYDDYEHAGVDLIVRNGPTLGAPVRACGDGKVTVNRPGDGWGDGSFGVCARIDHPDTPYWTIVAHLHDSVDVKTGDVVKAGQVVGRVGMTGLTTGPHTHFALQAGGGGSFNTARVRDASGIRRITNTQILDPMQFLKADAATPYVPTNAELAASLARTSDVTNQVLALATAQGESIATISKRVISGDAKLDRILKAIADAAKD